MAKSIKCIYCRKSKLKEKKLWNREHVIPEAFGKFKNNFVLHYTVCKECNQKFGDEIDLILSRESYEGKVLRYTEWDKDLDGFKEYKKYKSENIVVNQSDVSGAVAKLNTKDGKLSIVPKSQLLIKNVNGYNSYELGSIPPYSFFEKKGIDLSNTESFIILGVVSDIIKEMREKGYNPKIQEINGLKEPEITAKYTWCIENNFRGIAKLAFNYLAYWKGSDYVLRPEFDMIREFIYSGQIQNEVPVFPSSNPILKESNQTLGHIVTINAFEDKNILISEVMLFNCITYRVLLSPSIIVTKDEIRKGHFFNPFSGEIFDLEVH